MENLIYNELLIRGYNVDVGEVSIVTRNKEKKQERINLEVDFVCNLADKRIYVQSAYSLNSEEKYIQESRSLINIPDNFKKIIITYDSTRTHYTEDGILIVNIFDFLLNKNSLDY